MLTLTIETGDAARAAADLVKRGRLSKRAAVALVAELDAVPERHRFALWGYVYGRSRMHASDVSEWLRSHGYQHTKKGTE